MRISLISIGQKPPAWVSEGFEEYARRLPPHLSLQLQELPLGNRKADAAKVMREEAERVLDTIPKGDRVVLLDEHGKQHRTRDLAKRLDVWQQDGRDVSLVIGGPDGHGEAVRQAADETWSLSPLTFPHMLVRILVAEQLYRAWSILQNHPYHRE